MNGKRSLAADRRRRKLITSLWALALSAVVIVLIVLERTAILYILATLGVSALLAIVALSDLGQNESGSADESPGLKSDAASVVAPVSGRR
jgi:hypothetical protein